MALFFTMKKIIKFMFPAALFYFKFNSLDKQVSPPLGSKQVFIISISIALDLWVNKECREENM
jgi:hypothetical protein